MPGTEISLHDLQDQLREEIKRGRARSFWIGICVLASALCAAFRCGCTDGREVEEKRADGGPTG
jgi:hypothetical protein